MVNLRWITLVLAFLLGCSTLGYKYYGVDITALPEPEKGVLRGPKPENDLPLTMCLPSQASKSPCVVVFKSEFMAMAKELRELRIRLRECQAGH